MSAVNAQAPRVVTFGCRLNAYESEAIRVLAARAGLEDAVIVNTCAVTAEAERQARQEIRKLKRAHPGLRIIVTGCAAEIDPDRYRAMPEVARVLGNAEKLRPESYEARPGPPQADGGSGLRGGASRPIEGFEGRARAFLQAQNGCDHRCTFCVIPFGRGASRSVPLGALVAEAKGLLARGFREIVLSGVDLTAYGADLPGRPSLGEAVKRLLANVRGLERLRLSSLDPAEIDPLLEELIANEPRLMPHVHLSVQAGDDMILKRMKRRHGRDDVLRLCERLRARRPDIAFGADLIAGFPTETEAMFDNTLRLVTEAGLSFLHVFAYSERPGTPAARMPQVAKPLRKQRAARLRALGQEQLGRFLDSRIGTRARVLVEEDESGRSEHFACVRLDRVLAPGALIEALVTGRVQTTLQARVL